ncbi:MAG: LCP family protein [Spirochaetales bacterium]|nr:LCP family protein [Spirochaetales bacterium]
MKIKSGFFNKGTIFLVFIVFFSAGIGVFLYFQVRTDPVTTLISEERTIGVHFMLRSGEALLFSEIFLYHPRTSKGAIIDIPGNVGTLIESLNRMDRIGAVFQPEDTQAFRTLVENFVGFPIPFYCMFSLDEIERFVDILGGVEVFIANSMETDSQGNRVLLPSGNVMLDGGKARLFLSFLDPEETELDKIGRIQKFVQAMLKKMGESAAFLSNEALTPFLRSSLKTNLDNSAFQALCREIVKLDSDRIIFQRVLGAARTVDNQQLLFPHLEGQLFRDSLRQINANLASMDSRGLSEIAVSVEIQNGTQTTGLARRTREVFQSFGFDVVSFSNAENQDVEKTLVIDRRGNPDTASRAAGIIRCSNIITEIPGASSVAAADVTVLLGKDFDGRYCK